MQKSILTIILSYLLVPLLSQNCSSYTNMQLQADIPSTCNEMVMTMEREASGAPYLYIANKEAGLVIYDISNASFPTLAAEVPISLLGGLEVMNLTQEGSYLYLCLGNTFNNTQHSGMAIIDVSTPQSPIVTDYWETNIETGGTGDVVVQNDYAFLGAMNNGIYILDISNKNNISLVTQYIPDKDFPVANADTTKINARGLAIRDNFLYVCYDAGGFRIIDITNKNNPVQIGQYSNPVLDNLPRAYNNVIITDTIAFVTVDYCGIEVLKISDPANIQQLVWWNPWNCQTSGLNWFNSRGHANEIAYNPICHSLYLSTGKSDMYVLDVSSPIGLDSCTMFGGLNNNIGTWGVGYWGTQIYLSYICTAIPFSSNWTGVKILNFDTCFLGIEESQTSAPLLFPNPCQNILHLPIAAEEVFIYDLQGKCLTAQSGKDIDIHALPSGLYVIKVGNSVQKFVKE